VFTFPQILTFKTDCPCCGGTKKLKTKVNLAWRTYSKAKCHKCGHTLPAGKF